MSHQFKPGDLALIVGSIVEENIGKTVRLVEFAPRGSEPQVRTKKYLPIAHDSWIVETIDSSNSLVIPSNYTVGLIRVNAGICRRQWLMPLRGDFAPEQAKSREVPV